MKSWQQCLKIEYSNRDGHLKYCDEILAALS